MYSISMVNDTRFEPFMGTRTIKNALNTVMQSMVAIVIVTFIWIMIGFSLSFDGGNQWIGGLKFLGLHHVGLKLQNFESSYTSLIIYVVSNDVLYNCGIYFIRFDCRENEIHSLSDFCEFMGSINL